MGSYRELETAKYMNLDSESDVSYPPPETSPHLTTANQFASDNTQPASLSSDSQPSPEESSSKGKTWILVIGIALMGLGGMGVFNALNDRGEVPEKRGGHYHRGNGDRYDGHPTQTSNRSYPFNNIPG